MARSTMWSRSWSPQFCLIFYFTAVAWIVPWNKVIASPDPSAKISPDVKNAAEDLSNDELHALLSLLAGTNTRVNPPDSIILQDSSTTSQPPVLAPSVAPPPSTTTTPRPRSTTTVISSTSSVATTTSLPPTTTKPRVIIVPVTPATTTTTASDPTQKPRALASPPSNDLVQQLSFLNSLLGNGGNLGSLQNLNGADNNAAAEAAAALFGVAPAALIIPSTTTTTTTTTPRPQTTMKPIGTLDDTSAALQSLALLNVLLGNTGENSGNNSAAAALLGLGTASSSPAVRQTQNQAILNSQKEQEAAATLNLLLQSAGQGNPQLQNFVNSPNNMDTSASNQLSGLLGILGTLGTLGGQQQQSPALFNLGQQAQPQQPNFIGNIFGGQRQNPQAQQQANLLTSLFGGAPTTPAPSLPGFGLLSSMANLGSTIFSTVTNTLGGSRGDGRPRVRGKGVDTRLGVGYRFGDNADAQLMWEIGPQLFTEPLKNEESNGVGRKRQTSNGQGLLASASGRVLQMFNPQSQYPQNDNPPWRRSDTVDESIVSKEALHSVASSLPHQSLKTLQALLDMKKKLGTTPATTPAAKKLSSLFSWYTSTTPSPRRIHIPAQKVGPPASNADSYFSWFDNPATTPSSHWVNVPSTEMTPPKSSALDKFVNWYMGGSSDPPTTPKVPFDHPNSHFSPPNAMPARLNMDPSNFLKRSSMAPISPTASMMKNFYDKRSINPKTNIHSSLTTYEKFLLGIHTEEDLNKSLDSQQDLMTSPANNPFHQRPPPTRRNPPFGHNMRNHNGFHNGHGHPMGQLRRSNPMHFRQNRPQGTNAPFLNGPPNHNRNFMPNRRPMNENQFSFERHNNIVTMKGVPPGGPPTTLRPPGVRNGGMRRRFGKQPPPPFARKSGFSFSSLNPFAGLFGKKNRPRNHYMNNQQQFPPMEQNYDATDLTGPDTYNPYGSFNDNANPPNNFDSYNNAAHTLAKIRNGVSKNHQAQKVVKEDSGQEEEDTATAASIAHPTKVKYNPHQNFISEAEESYLRRNAIVTNPKLRQSELEKLFGEINKDKNTTHGQSKSDGYETETESPFRNLMGLVQNVLNTRIKAKINNKEKNIPSIRLVTEKPMLPRPKGHRPKLRTKLKITNGKPEIVIVPEQPKEMKPIVHVGEDMSFEDFQQFYDVSTTTKKPKTKKKLKPKEHKKTELIIDDDTELSEEEDDSKEVFIDIDSGEVSVLKPVAALTSFEPLKDEEEDDSHLDEETRRKNAIYANLQKQLQSSYEKMKKAQLRAIAKQKRKEELAAKGLDESLDMVSKYFDLVEESEKVEGKTHHDPMRQESQRYPYLSPPPPHPAFQRQPHRPIDHSGYTSNTSYSKLRKNRKRRRRALEIPYTILMM